MYNHNKPCDNCAFAQKNHPFQLCWWVEEREREREREKEREIERDRERERERERHRERERERERDFLVPDRPQWCKYKYPQRI